MKRMAALFLIIFATAHSRAQSIDIFEDKMPSKAASPKPAAPSARVVKPVIETPSRSAKCAEEKFENYLHSRSGKGDSTNEHFALLYRANPCFTSTSKDFWKDITENYALDYSPQLKDLSGQGRFSNLEPAWLYKKALKVSDNSPRAAFALLTMCMHDDVGDGFTDRLQGPIALAEIKNSILSTNEEIKELQERLIKNKIEMSSSEADLVSGKIALLRARVEYLKKINDASSPEFIMGSWMCPTDENKAYLSLALDSGVDVPAAFKEEIEEVLGRGQKARAQNFVTGAYLGCQLVRCGLNSEKAEELVMNFAEENRMAKLNVLLKRLHQQRALLASVTKLEPDAPEFHGAVLKTLISKNGKLSLTQKRAAFILKDSRLKAGVEEELAEELRLRANEVLAKIDAAAIFGKLSFDSAAKKSVKTAQDEFLGIIGSSRQIATGDTSCGIRTWSKERCQNAKRWLAIWDIEKRWLRAQQGIGARFGYRQCEMIGGVTPEKLLCKGMPPAGATPIRAKRTDSID